jgi:hypothetical protein
LVLYEDMFDHRLNSRTVYLNPVFRFQHHMFPMVPYHAPINGQRDRVSEA